MLVRARDAVINEDEAGSIRYSTGVEVRIGAHMRLHQFVVAQLSAGAIADAMSVSFIIIPTALLWLTFSSGLVRR
jgi:hypothetical protein